MLPESLVALLLLKDDKMGANVSVGSCQASNNITLNCNGTAGQFWGNAQKGQVEADPDIAGIGVGTHPLSRAATSSQIPVLTPLSPRS